jgi:hypothetical protein
MSFGAITAGGTVAADPSVTGQLAGGVARAHGPSMTESGRGASGDGGEPGVALVRTDEETTFGACWADVHAAAHAATTTADARVPLGRLMRRG